MSGRWLWAAVATGPLAWMTTLLVNSIVSDLACGPGIRPWLIAVAVAMLGLDLAAAVVAWRSVRATPPMRDDALHDRHGPFLAHAALLSSLLFAVAIAAHVVPPVVLHDCR